jgi:hypothetical protein
MSWNQILQIDPGPDVPLRQRIDALFAQQCETWPLLREGEAALAGMQKKTLTLDGESVVVQVNPARWRSTLAKTDAKAVAARACFLCPENMPAEERGMEFEDLVVMPNPFPVLPLHCTIAGREHQPQRIADRIDSFLRLAEAIGSDLATFYNGPRCGASAPDHFHFQAGRADAIPILAQRQRQAGGRAVVAHSSFGRRFLIFESNSAAKVRDSIERTIDALRQIDTAAGESLDEPMFNLLAHFDDARFRVVLFPRAAHRPACYFKTGSDQLTISPAVLEMCGVLVTTESEHFARLDAEIARDIYDEVSIDARRFERLVRKIT